MEFAASFRRPLTEFERLGAADPAEQISVTLYLRRRAPLPAPAARGQARLTREELREQYGASPADVDLVLGILASKGITVVEVDPGARRVLTAGPLSAYADTFGTSVDLVRSLHRSAPQGVTHRYRTGELALPGAFGGAVIAVLGIDNRPQAAAHFRPAKHRKKPTEQTSYTPLQVGEAYGFPAGTDGTGQSIAIIELGGGFAQADLDTYFSGLGLSTPVVTAVPVDGGANTPTGSADGPDGEVMLDIEVAGALAPGATQLVYFSPNTDQGFVDAVTAAAHASPTPTAISISWGGPEDSWTAQGRTALDAACADAAALGVTVTVAAGDNGSADGDTDGQAHCDFPASSPHVLACGGTSMQLDASGRITAETVWNDGSGGGATGGGVSAFFARPAWQTDAGVPAVSGAGGRGVPDVSGNADPETGYQIRVDGQASVVGGTSAVAPLWAALIARLAQANGGRPLGPVQTVFYDGVKPGTVQPGFNDVSTGDNGAFTAGPGWDACTGLGSPDGAVLAGLFDGSAAGGGGSAA
ncbi:MAG TPA: S53 family peptidase [Actinocrinis sp.]|nr:S53 family peptidase [Actinocrinis sp.]